MLRGASAEAQADLTSELEGSKGDADKLGEELFGVAAVLRGEPAVRRIAHGRLDRGRRQGGPRRATSSATPSATTALSLVKSAVKRRWTALARPRRRDRGARRAGRGPVRRRRRQQDQRRALRGPSSRRRDATGCARRSRTRRDRRRTRASCCAPCSRASCCPPRCCWSSRRSPARTAPSTARSRASSTSQRTAIGEKIATVHTARELSDDERSRLAERSRRAVRHRRSTCRSWWTPTSSAASGSRSVTTSSTAPSPASSRTPNAELAG